ncbi:MAG: ferritin-like domain-containing protein [Gemmatimonas sp.]
MENTQLLSTVDPEILTAVDKRAHEISQGASVNGKLAAMLALGSIPIALGAIAKDVYGQTPPTINEVLQYALLLEHLEAEFYTRGVAAAGMIPAAVVPVFTQIRNHENAHVTALQNLLTGRGQTPRTRPAFDFTAKGSVAGFNFGSTQYPTFLALAQAFEDTGVRAYKGQAGNVMSDKAILNAALSIHSVEARHASIIRRINGQKGWITGNNRGTLPAFTQGIYDGEDVITQNGVNISTVSGFADNGGTNAATEAWDEPLTMAQVTAIVTPFLP